MKKRTMNRKELRDEYDAAERRKEEEEVDEDQDDDEEDEDEEEEAEAEAEAEAEGDVGDEEEDEEEEAPPKNSQSRCQGTQDCQARSRTAHSEDSPHQSDVGRVQQLQPACGIFRVSQMQGSRGESCPVDHRQETDSLRPADQGTD